MKGLASTWSPPPPRADALVVHVVDDDEAVRRSLALLLVSFGHVAETYASPETFLASIGRLQAGLHHRRHPHARDGRTGIAGGVAATQLPDAVIVVTGHGDVCLAVRAMKAGAVDFIEKPYSDDDLLRAVDGALARFEDERQQHFHRRGGRADRFLTSRERDVSACWLRAARIR